MRYREIIEEIKNIREKENDYSKYTNQVHLTGYLVSKPLNTIFPTGKECLYFKCVQVFGDTFFIRTCQVFDRNIIDFLKSQKYACSIDVVGMVVNVKGHDMIQCECIEVVRVFKTLELEDGGKTND